MEKSIYLALPSLTLTPYFGPCGGNAFIPSCYLAILVLVFGEDWPTFHPSLASVSLRWQRCESRLAQKLPQSSMEQGIDRNCTFGGGIIPLKNVTLTFINGVGWGMSTPYKISSEIYYADSVLPHCAKNIRHADHLLPARAFRKE